MPTPAPVIGATLARMRSTSAKASVTSAKYEPRRPERNVSPPTIAPTSAPPRNAEREGDPGIDAVAHLQHRSDISAGAEEGGVTERILSAIAAEHVPALAGKRNHQRDDEKIQRYV